MEGCAPSRPLFVFLIRLQICEICVICGGIKPVSNPPFHIIATDHTGITVANLERSLSFWRDVLGFELSHRPHHTGDLAAEVTGVPGAEISIAVLKGYGHKIELLEYLAPADRKRVDLRPCDVGSVHVAFTVDDLDAVLNARLATISPEYRKELARRLVAEATKAYEKKRDEETAQKKK